jgi:hypothetical protein
MFFVDIEYQNFTRIHQEEILLVVLIYFQENIVTAVRNGIQSYSHTNHIVVSIKYGYWNTGSSG